MKRIALLCVLALCACPGPSKSDGGTDAGGFEEFFFDVSGTAFVFPEGAAMLADAGMSTSVSGLTLRVEEPLKVALKDPLGEFSSKVLDSTGTFSASMISTELVNLGVAAGVVDDAGTRAVRSATVIWDVALEGKKPDRNLTGAKAWVLPVQLHAALTASVTEARIMTFTGANMKRSLVAAGCVVGRVVDATGVAVSGVTLVSTTASLNSRFVYPTADLSTTGAATSSNGLFLYVHDGSDNVAQFNFDVMGATGYKRRSAGAAKDACLVMTVYPGYDAASVNRCAWAVKEEMWKYHDLEWGLPVHDDRKHFEFLVLEGAQAGLSWSTILKRREGYRKAFARFDPEKVARFGARDVARCLKDPGIIRNRLKVESVLKNARAFLKVQEEDGSFDSLMWKHFDGRPKVNRWKTSKQIPATSRESDAVSKELKARGFTFVGSTIVYAHLQACGLVNDHLVSCPRWKQVQR